MYEFGVGVLALKFSADFKSITKLASLQTYGCQRLFIHENLLVVADTNKIHFVEVFETSLLLKSTLTGMRQIEIMGVKDEHLIVTGQNETDSVHSVWSINISNLTDPYIETRFQTFS